MKRILIVSLLLSLIQVVFTQTVNLKVNSDTKAFKVAVFSDLLVDNDGSNYAFTMQLMQNVIDLEEQVDLAVLMGNTVDPDFETSYSQRFEEAVAYLKIRGIPWVSTGGIDRGEFSREKKVLAEWEIGENSMYDYGLSLSGAYAPVGRSEQIGHYTQKLPIYNLEGTKEVFKLWILDSQGTYGCGKNNLNGKSCITKEAIDWFQSEAKKTLTKGQAEVVFTTNPIPEMMKIANDCTFFGQQKQEVCCQAENMGLFEACQVSGKIGWIVSGGDSSNNFRGEHQKINLAISPKSGFGGNTGNLLKAARIMQFKLDGDSYKITSWTRDQDGEVEMQNTPAEACNRQGEDPSLRPNSSQPIPIWKPQQQCCSLYSKNADTEQHKKMKGDKQTLLFVTPQI